MLSEICEAFASEVEALDPKSDDYGIQLRPLVLKLVRDAAAQVEGYGYGEIPALLELSRLVLAWIEAEAELAEDRQYRYARQRAVLNLQMLCAGICRFHTGRRRAAGIAQFREQIADALRPVVEYAAENADVPPVIIDDETLRKLARAIRTSSS